jgi:GT2 family glycosyltransferase
MTGLVAIAISAYQSDDAVVSLLETIFSAPHPQVQGIIVVDSLGSGKILEIAAAREWPLRYESASTNLGSAGNLARRMELAAEIGAQWCLCLNHDAKWDPNSLSAMLAAARARPRVGAVYPVIDHSPREPRWQEGPQRFTPSSRTRLSKIPADEPTKVVLWSASNFALYATAPLDEGVTVMAELWLGYEDLAYGIALHHGGWVQLSCRSAILTNGLDYASRRLLGHTFIIPDKPNWYSYYNIRNLILIRRRYGPEGISIMSIIWKLFQSSFRTLLLEEQKIARLNLLYAGCLAGLANRSGKGPLP